MNIALPGLIFSSVVPAFTSHNVTAMGPLFLQAFVSGSVLPLGAASESSSAKSVMFLEISGKVSLLPLHSATSLRA